MLEEMSSGGTDDRPCYVVLEVVVLDVRLEESAPQGPGGR